jgi:hypothetical protein
MSVSSTIYIGDLPKGDVLAALYNAAKIHPEYQDFARAFPAQLTNARGARIIGYVDKLNPLLHFTQLGGRMLKIDLATDYLNPSSYDRENGEGAAQAVISRLRGVEVA